MNHAMHDCFAYASHAMLVGIVTLDSGYPAWLKGRDVWSWSHLDSVVFDLLETIGLIVDVSIFDVSIGS